MHHIPQHPQDQSDFRANGRRLDHHSPLALGLPAACRSEVTNVINSDDTPLDAGTKRRCTQKHSLTFMSGMLISLTIMQTFQRDKKDFRERTQNHADNPISPFHF
jgi:hypothetical protein